MVTAALGTVAALPVAHGTSAASRTEFAIQKAGTYTQCANTTFPGSTTLNRFLATTSILVSPEKGEGTGPQPILFKASINFRTRRPTLNSKFVPETSPDNGLAAAKTAVLLRLDKCLTLNIPTLPAAQAYSGPARAGATPE